MDLGVTTSLLLIPLVCSHSCTGAATKTMLLLRHCLLEASVRWLPPSRQHHATADPPVKTLSLLVTSNVHIYNPSVYIAQDTTEEPDPRPRVSTPARSTLIGRYAHRKRLCLRRSACPTACNLAPSATILRPHNSIYTANAVCHRARSA